jgi:hypothetical protein
MRKPPCFNSDEEWELYARKDSHNPRFKPTWANKQFCDDCTPDYRARMASAGRCLQQMVRWWWEITPLVVNGMPTGRAAINQVVLSQTPTETELLYRYFATRGEAVARLPDLGWIED